MFKNYIKTAFRSIFRHKGISLINILGLAMGLTCSILIFLWVNHQLSFDKSQINKKRIYRLEAVDWVNLPTHFRKCFSDFPEIQEYVMFNSWETPVLKYKDSYFEQDHFIFADKCVFDVFTLPLIRGNPKTALESPLSLVLTESMSKKIFGNEDPIGKTIIYDNEFHFTVTAVMEDVNNFHVEMNALAPFESLPDITGRKDFLEEYSWNHPTYLLLKEGSDIQLLENKINESFNRLISGENKDFLLRPFKEIYFASHLKREKGVKHGSRQLIVLFTVVAFLILLIACINFINLTTARVTKRAKEISVRKVVGAHQKNLITQFLGETFLIVSISQVIALALIRLFLPIFSRLTGDNLTLNYMDPSLVIIILSLFLFTGVAAGMFPSVYLSSLSPFALIKGRWSRSVKDVPLRKILIVFQFSVSVFLIIGTVTVFNQIDFMRNRNLGFRQEQIVNVNLRGELQGGKKIVFREQLLRNPDISKVSNSSQLLGILTNINTWTVRGKEKQMVIMNTDPDFIDVMELELVEGRNFSWKMETDKKKKYIINQEAAKFLELDSPIGETVRANFGQSEIIGIVKDFHFRSLHNKIGPMAICWYERWADIANIRISGMNIQKTIGYIQEIWSELCPDFPFNYSFMDESLAKLYIAEGRLGDTLKYFVFLALFLSCLGMFGLSAFIAEQKTKEIGIRKVLGASPSSITVLLSKQFMKWVLLSNVIAWPISHYVMNNWLHNFAYRINISVLTFVVAAVFALIVALFAVSYQSLKAASASPADSLKYE